MLHPHVLLASLDLFWLPHLATALQTQATVHLHSTWGRRAQLPPGLTLTNVLPLHLALSTYKRLPFLQYRNLAYDALCHLFDTHLEARLPRQADALYVLSGCGLKSLRRFRSWNKPAVIESGSCHTDFQHRIVWEEYRRNGLRAPLFPESYRRRVRQEFIEADFIQIPTRFVQRTYLEAGLPESKLLVAPYGANVDRFAPRSTTDLDPKFRVICSSGVNLRKGARLLVEAWRKLAWRDAELHWIGWPDHPQVRHLFRDPLPNVVWHGWMPHEQLAALYRSCDVKVLPSFEEGLARVLLEAAASGLPLIATPNTGIEDFFTPGDPEGWLIEAGSVDALCQALQEAKADRLRTFSLGQRAAARARQGFSWNDYGHRVRENFGKVMGARASVASEE